MNTHFCTRPQQVQRREVIGSTAPQHHGKLTSTTVGRHPWSRTDEEFFHDNGDEHYVKQIQQVKAELKQREAALNERDAKLHQQSCIIEALVYQMSEMQDLLEQKRCNTSTETIYHCLTSLQKENKELQKQVGYLESELANRQDQLLLKSKLYSDHR